MIQKRLAMFYEPSEIHQAFRTECDQRLRRAKGALEAVADGLAVGVCYARVHQELDSLYGAARAVNFEEWERFSRALDDLLGSLRARLPETDIKQHQLLEKGISLVLHCNRETATCLVRHSREARQLIQSIDAALA